MTNEKINADVQENLENQTASKEIIINDETGKSVEIFSGEGSRFFSSIVNSSRESGALILKAMANPTATLKAVADKKILYVTDVLAHDVKMVSEDGEVQDAIRVVLICENGDTVAGVSSGLRASLTNLMNVIGKPPWNPSLPVFIASVTTRRGFNTFNILVATDDVKLPAFGKK